MEGKNGYHALTVVLAVLMCVVLLLQILEMAKSRQLRDAVGVLRAEVEKLQASCDRNEKLGDQVHQLDGTLAKVREEIGALTENGRKVQSELAGLKGELMQMVGEELKAAGKEGAGPGQAGTTAAPTEGKTLQSELAALRDRIEKVRRDVIQKETKILQDQVTALKVRADKADREVLAIQQRINQDDVPTLKARVDAVAKQVSEVETSAKVLAKESEEFKTRLIDFFKEVFYNDPYGRLSQEALSKVK